MQIHIAHATIYLNDPHAIPDQLMEFSSATHCTAEPASAALTPPAHGEIWHGQGGRYICTLPALLDAPARHLVASHGEAEDLAYGPAMNVPGACSHANGPANTAALLATDKDHPAAQWAAAYTADGHIDFFLPARLDLLMAHIWAPQLFKKAGWHFSSTQVSRDGAFAQDFGLGSSHYHSKGHKMRVRAFRWVPLNA